MGGKLSDKTKSIAMKYAELMEKRLAEANAKHEIRADEVIAINKGMRGLVYATAMAAKYNANKQERE